MPRLANRTEPRILCVAVPKAGTHLLERALCLHPRLYRKLVPTVSSYNIHRWGDLPVLLPKVRPGQIIVSHHHYEATRAQAVRDNRVKCIFMMRDPRDMAVSRAFYLPNPKVQWHPQHAIFAEQPDVRSRILLSIKGYAPTDFLSIKDTIGEFAGWEQPDFLLIRFEDLIGEAGGSTVARQHESLARIYDYLEMPMTTPVLHDLAARLFSRKSPTFNKGVVGRWTEFFDEEVKQIFKENAGAELIQYGYEQDDTW